MGQRRTYRRWAGRGALVLAVASAARLASLALPRFSATDSAARAGTYHVHTSDSHDSRVPLSTYVAAARRLDLDFLVVTDHNVQHPVPRRVDGITVVSWAELTTPFGHVVGLGAPIAVQGPERGSATPLAALRHVGAAPIVAHPTDGKRPWCGPLADAAGVEVANWSASARRRASDSWLGLLGAVVAWPWRPDAALVQAYDRDAGALALWDERPEADFVGLCAVDAHGWIPPHQNLKGWHLVLPEGGDALENVNADLASAALYAALQAGRFYCAAGALGAKPAFTFGAKRHTAWVAQAGDSVPAAQVDAIVTSASPMDHGPRRLVLLRDGIAVQQTEGPRLVWPKPGPGTYRVEVWVPMPQVFGRSRWVPGIYSNKLRLEAT